MPLLQIPTKTSTDKHLYTVMCIFSPNADSTISNHITSPTAGGVKKSKKKNRNGGILRLRLAKKSKKKTRNGGILGLRLAYTTAGGVKNDVENVKNR